MPPFSTDRLDALMDRAGIDALVVTSGHNIRYLTGGHAHFMYEAMPAIGTSRYLPVLVYPKGRPDLAAYVGSSEKNALANDPIWVPNILHSRLGSVAAMRHAVEYLGKLPGAPRTIGFEHGFMPADAADALRAGFDASYVEAQRTLELMRAVKRPDELALLREASERVIDAMLSVVATHGPGQSKREIIEALRRAETDRGLVFDYALVTLGASLDRAPSDQVWQPGELLCLDSGGNYRGYIGDLCRMAIDGAPDAEMADLLMQVDAVQQAARRVVRAGLRGGDIYAAAEPALAACADKAHMHFVAHGMGLVSHEAPRLTGTGPIPYPGDDADTPLEAGMVLSIETTLAHPRRGFVKLEDTVAVTAEGYEAFGDAGRGWNRAGA